MKLPYAAAVVLSSMIGLTEANVPLAKPNMEEIRFRVLLDDKHIGYHTFTINNDGAATVVDVKAEFDVRVLFIRAYSYVHENVETWEGGCLSRIDAKTDDNGKRFKVSGQKTNDAFELVTLDRSQSLSHDCIKTFAYWDRDFLNQSRLLNAQTGEYIDVNVEALGKRSFELSDSVAVADGFRIVADEDNLSISVWYQEKSNRWLALESALPGGKTLRYLPAGTSIYFSETGEAESSAEPG